MNINDFLNVAIHWPMVQRVWYIIEHVLRNMLIKIESLVALARLFVQVFSLWNKQAGEREYLKSGVK